MNITVFKNAVAVWLDCFAGHKMYYPTVRLTVMKCTTNIHTLLGLICNIHDGPLTFHLAPSSSQILFIIIILIEVL